MATDDRQILVTGTAPAPATWLVPGNGQVTPRTIFAHFNGAAAASAFFPALKVISDAGQTVGIYPCQLSVAAGGSADVSWFPGLGGSASGSVQALVGARILATQAQTVNDSTATDLVYQSVDFDTDGMANLAADNRKLTVNTPGLYLVAVEATWPYASGSAGRRLVVLMQNQLYSVSNTPVASQGLMPIWAPVGGTGGGNPHTETTALTVLQCNAGDFIASGADQISGAATTVNGTGTCFLTAVLIAG